MLFSLPADQIKGQGREIGHRFIQMPDRLFQIMEGYFRDHQYRMFGVKLPGHQFGKRQFTERGIRITDGKGS